MEQFKKELQYLKQLIKLVKVIRTLHMSYYVSKLPIKDCALEFFFAIDDLLTGYPVDSLKLQLINKKKFLDDLNL